jgi:hypothetical protein
MFCNIQCLKLHGQHIFDMLNLPKYALISCMRCCCFYVQGAAAVAVAAANAVCGIALLCSFFGVPHRAAVQFRPLLLFGILPFLIIAYNLKSGLSQEHFCCVGGTGMVEQSLLLISPYYNVNQE